MSRGLQVIVVTLAIVVALLLGTTVLSGLTASEDGIRFNKGKAVLLGANDKYTEIAEATGYDETVYNSRGYAVNLSGSDDSYVESNTEISVSDDDTWTVAVWAYAANGSGSSNLTAVSLDGRVVITYNGSQGNWSAWYYQDGARDSYTVNVSAPNQTENFTNVMAVSNGTHFTIYRNNTQGDVVNISTSSISSAPNASNWNGRLDELRTFDDALNNSERQALVDSPIDPRPNNNRSARVMFDQTDKGRQLIFFADAKLLQNNVSFSTGLAGSELTAGTDYEWSTSGPQIKPLSGGALESAPVAYVDYEFESALASTLGAWSDFVELAALVPVMVIVAAILVRARSMQ